MGTIRGSKKIYGSYSENIWELFADRQKIYGSYSEKRKKYMGVILRIYGNYSEIEQIPKEEKKYKKNKS